MLWLLDKGRVTLTVPYEFEVILTVVSDDVTLPWRLLDLHILVGDALPGIVDENKLLCY